jgi:hypothetical protein
MLEKNLSIKNRPQNGLVGGSLYHKLCCSTFIKKIYTKIKEEDIYKIIYHKI